jgi:hypothetical protein
LLRPEQATLINDFFKKTPLPWSGAFLFLSVGYLPDNIHSFQSLLAVQIQYPVKINPVSTIGIDSHSRKKGNQKSSHE